MTIEQKTPQLDPLKGLEQFEKMMKMIKQFPVKENKIVSISTAGKWELYPKSVKVSLRG